MNKIIENIEVNNKIVSLIIYKKDIKRLNMRIGEYNQENQSFDVIVSIPKRNTVESAVQLFYKNLNWYIKHTIDKQDYIIRNDERYLFGKKVSVSVYNSSIEDSLKYITNVFYARMKDFKVYNVNLKFKHLRSKWGSYNKNTNTIVLNSKLISVNYDLIDYVICHELTHLFVFDHSNKFYNYLGTYYPNYKEARTRLKKYSSFL